MSQKVRQSGLELLRIIAMLLIVAHHFVVHGGGGGIAPSEPFNNAFFNFVSIGGKIGVNVFFMISAYFLCDKKFSFKGIIKTISASVFYSLLFFTIFSCINGFSWQGFAESILSFIFQYWFVAIYLLFMIIVPILAMLIKKLSKQIHFDICAIGFIVLCVVPAIIFLINGWHFDSKIFFFYLVFPMSYIKLYVKKINRPLMATVLVLCYAIGTVMGIFLPSNPNVACSNTIINFFIALSLFMLFKGFNFTSKFINGVASTTFGVYLIHDNPYVRNVLWKFVASLGQIQKPYWFVFCIATVLAIYLICTVIEIARLALFGAVKKLFAKKTAKMINF